MYSALSISSLTEDNHCLHGDLNKNGPIGSYHLFECLVLGRTVWGRIRRRGLVVEAVAGGWAWRFEEPISGLGLLFLTLTLDKM